MRGAALLAAACAITMSGCVLEPSLDEFLDSPGPRPPARTSLPGATIDPQAIYERARGSVVTVISEYGLVDGTVGLGTGFLNGDRQTVITNAHVVTDFLEPAKRADAVFLQLSDGTRMDAEILGVDPHGDISVLRAERSIDAEPLVFAREQPAVGDPVMAIGTPLGETYTMSLGYVTGEHRRISGLAGFKIYGAIQTDAVITMGNSGGPLLNARGEVIGVNGQMLSIGGGGEGLGFAIPAPLVDRSASFLRDRRDVPYAYLGVNGKPLWRGASNYEGIPDRPGVLIGEVRAGSPAAMAGLRAGAGNVTVQGSDMRLGGDLITAIDDHQLAFNEQLGEALLGFEPGQVVTITFQRDGRRHEVRVTLENRPLLWPSPWEMFFG